MFRIIDCYRGKNLIAKEVEEGYLLDDKTFIHSMECTRIATFPSRLVYNVQDSDYLDRILQDEEFCDFILNA